uniref:GDP-fucose protein O-fucosyltransferase 2 n=1 Tax=Timema poppense TaxID=170557 RepID=A0A7R9DE45_TIMPO|nr:unnamed protein product [Timema poppensis]
MAPLHIPSPLRAGNWYSYSSDQNSQVVDLFWRCDQKKARKNLEKKNLFVTDTNSLDTSLRNTNQDSVATNSKFEVETLPRYILYDVNPLEGFNLRRDVYMRYAVLARRLQQNGDNWHLVLPPWGNLYHWQSRDVGSQTQLPWSLFFDIPSLQAFAPVLEMHSFFQEYKKTVFDQVFVLQHFKDSFENGIWEEKFEIQNCPTQLPNSQTRDGLLCSSQTRDGLFWGYSNMSAERVQCLSFHGRVSQLETVLSQHCSTVRTVVFDHAEVALHDTFGDRVYWSARRSMRFNLALHELAAQFRREYLNSTDEVDGTVREFNWTIEKPMEGTRGGPFLSVHLRRKDFLWGRPKDIPSLKSASVQIDKLLRGLALVKAFIATDAPQEEFEELQSYLPKYQLFRYTPSKSVKEMYKDGGVAIIDQIICSHARYFVGTYESTFSFRIQEEREILGFPPHTTFNRLCGDDQDVCTPPSKWRIVY